MKIKKKQEDRMNIEHREQFARDLEDIARRVRAGEIEAASYSAVLSTETFYGVHHEMIRGYSMLAMHLDHLARALVDNIYSNSQPYRPDGEPDKFN